MPYDWRKLDRLLTQIGDTAHDQMVFRAHSALGGECDNRIELLKLVTNLVITGSNFGETTSEPWSLRVSWCGTKNCTK